MLPWKRPRYFIGNNPNVKLMVTHVSDKHETYDYRYWGPIMRLWGIMEGGQSVLVRVQNFRPYFYTILHEDVNIVEFRKHLNQTLAVVIKDARQIPRDNPGEFIYDIVSGQKTNIMGYHSKQRLMYKITLKATKHVRPLQNYLEKNLKCPTFEANISFTMRFMNDHHIACCQWITIPNGEQYIVANNRKVSKCDLELLLSYSHVIEPLSTVQHSYIAPIRIFAFDIECCKIGRGFVTPELDPVSHIACVTEEFNPSRPLNYIDSVVFALVPQGRHVKLPLPESHIRVCEYECEATLLVDFAKYISQVDPDLFTGYNIDGFDWKYLFQRAKVLGADDFFKHLGRDVFKTSWLKKSTFSSKAFGSKEDFSAQIEGRFSFDMLKYIFRSEKLRSYTLNNVSNEFLGDTKIEMPYPLIPVYQNGTDEQRAHLTYYCYKDAELCLQLMYNRMAFVNSVEQSRVTGVPMDYLLARGAQIKTLSNLLQFTYERGYVIPSSTDAENAMKTKGATVIEPLRGFHEDPVCTLDFKSLYPSIMIWRNICYTTKALKKRAKKELGQNDYFLPENENANYVFVKPHIRKGILPEICQLLLDQRQIAKDDLKLEKDPAKRAVLDGRQLALKVVCNSVYGFVKANMVCDKDLMSGVTGYGRWMIEQTKRIAEVHYAQLVVYGDTDSVMVKMKGKSVEETFAVGRLIAKECTEFFGPPHVLELEKVHGAFLLIGKKRYAGCTYMYLGAAPRLTVSGLESIRRDNAKIGSETLQKCLDMILMRRDYNMAIQYVHRQLELLVTGKMDMSKLIISAGLSKTKEHYENSTARVAHAELAKRIEARAHKTGETIPATGDRVKYVITAGNLKKNAAHLGALKKSDVAEDPAYVIKHQIPISVDYYIEKQMMKPLCKIFTPILAPKEMTFKYALKGKHKGERKDLTLKEWQSLTAYKVLFTGSHMRHSNQRVAQDNTFGIAQFITKTYRCDICNSRIVKNSDDDTEIICQRCKTVNQHRIQPRIQELTDIEDITARRFTEAWTRCQRCVGSLHKQVLCGNMDCDNFFHREAVKKDLEEVTEKLARYKICY